MAGRRCQFKLGAAAAQPMGGQERAAGTLQEAVVEPTTSSEVPSMSHGGKAPLLPSSLLFAGCAKPQLPDASSGQHPPSAVEPPVESRDHKTEDACTSAAEGSDEKDPLINTARSKLSAGPDLVLGTAAGPAVVGTAQCSTSLSCGRGGQTPAAQVHLEDDRAGGQGQNMALPSGHALSGAGPALLCAEQAAEDLGSMEGQDRVPNEPQAGCGPPPATAGPSVVDQQGALQSNMRKSNHGYGRRRNCGRKGGRGRGQGRGEDHRRCGRASSSIRAHRPTRQRTRQEADFLSDGDGSGGEKPKKLRASSTSGDAPSDPAGTPLAIGLPSGSKDPHEALHAGNSEPAAHAGALSQIAAATEISGAADWQGKTRGKAGASAKDRPKQARGQAKPRGTQNGRKQPLREASKRREPVVDSPSERDSSAELAEQDKSSTTSGGFVAEGRAPASRPKRKAAQAKLRQTANGKGRYGHAEGMALSDAGLRGG